MAGWGADVERGGSGSAGWGASAAADQARSYQHADREYMKLCNDIQRQLKRLSAVISDIEKCSKNLGTRRDTRQNRSKLSHACDEGASLVDSLKRAIQRDFKSMTTGVSSMERKKRNAEQSRYMKQLTAYRTRYLTVSKAAAEKEEQYVSVARASISSGGRGGGAAAGGGTLSSDDDGDGGALLEFQQVHADLEFTEADIADREEAIAGIRQDVEQVQTIFTDLANLVEDQGETMDNVEWNVQEAHARAEHGVKHLEQATKYQKSYRKSLYCIICFIVVAAAAITLFLVLRR